MDERELTPSEAERVRLVRRGFQLYVGGDIEGMLELYDDGVEVTAGEWMNAGPFHGHAGFMEWLRRWNEAWDTFDFDIRSIEPVGERHVVAEVFISGRGAGSGIEVGNTSGWVAEVRNGLGRYVEVTASVEKALEIARRREGLGA
jgi:ketosteroid isomerase-like protein